MFSTYILYSKAINKFYIGFTGEEVHFRLAKHLAHHKGFTAKTNDWKIVHTENFETKLQAQTREKQIKGWKNAERIWNLIRRSATQ
ncbi:MAG: GIY-YIG nuclease family protein [Chitinophagaceae bacterium]|nr:GIY-YIG nuclease family protein [Chitinophagaceae bacterium]